MIPAAALIKPLLYASIFFFLSLHGEETVNVKAEFSPPQGWVKNLSPLPSSRVKTSFFTKGRKEFCPSINLTEEKVSLSIEEYIKAVRTLYQADPDNRWRRLGTLKTKGGTAHLTSLDMQTPLGSVRVLQSIFLDQGTAYILTGAVLQEDFGLYQKDLINCFRSFHLVSSKEAILHHENLK